LVAISAPALASSPRRSARPGAAQPGPERVQRLFRRYARFGDLTARDELFERFLPLARALARRYQRGSEPLDDLMQVASIALLGAIDRFDPERGGEFATFAVPTITGELKRYFRDHGWAMKVPRGPKDRLVTINRCVEQLSAARGGRPPTPSEIATASGLTVEEVLEALELPVATRPISLDSPAGHRDDEEGTVADTIGAEDPALERVERRDVLTRSLRGLTPREHRVLYMRFFEDRTQLEIGREVGLSQMQISRVLRIALERARDSAAAGPPPDRTSARV
jgi:RNA polymerase sigma-B factor